MITAVLNGFKRPHTLKEQYESIKAQTVSDVKIMFWGTMEDTSIDFPSDVINICTSAVANTNHGTWGRFAYSLLTDTKYVCVIDDDTIPGSKWFENCLQTMETHRGVLSTRGAIMDPQYDREYPSPRSYKPVGWCDKTKRPLGWTWVAIAGFLKRSGSGHTGQKCLSNFQLDGGKIPTYHTP